MIRIRRPSQYPTFLLWAGWLPLVLACAVAWAGQSSRGWGAELLLSTLLLFPLGPLLVNRRSASRLRVGSVRCEPFHENETGHLKVEVESNSRVPISDVQIQVYDAAAHCDVDPVNGACVSVPLKDHARGRFTCPHVKVSTRFPFGLFNAHRFESRDEAYVVYAAPELDAPAWPEPETHPDRVSRSGEEVVALREYQTGDALGTVDWKVSARAQSLVVRQFEHHRPHALQFRFDQVASLGVEHAVSRLTAWVIRAHAQGRPYSLELEGQTWGPAHSASHRHACLAALACFKQQEGP